jgi:hypothetical protein
MEHRRTVPALAGLLVLVLVTACSTGAAGSPSGPVGSSPGPSGDASPSADPSPADPGGGGGPGDDGSLVFPVPGVIAPQPVTVETVSAEVRDGHVVVRLEWTSGVEPCHALAGVDVVRDGDTFTLTVFEGTTDPDAMCIEIAMSKATLVDLGELPAGEYTIRAEPAGPAAVTITVP